jgi:inosine/xanthosine triphosphate pyrophosphatase family protein
MTLRLRRGTDAERITITPAEGELIYTTDSKLLYVGDGLIIGGNLVGSFDNNLNNDLNLNNFNITGNGNIALTGDIEVNGNILSTGIITSTTVGLHVGDVKGSIFGDDSSIIIDGITGAVTTNQLNVFGNATISGQIQSTNITANSLQCAELIASGGGVGIGEIRIKSSNLTDRTRIVINSNDQSSTINLRRSSETLVNPGIFPYYNDGSPIGQINFESVDSTLAKTHIILQSSKSYFRVCFLDSSNQIKENTMFKITTDGNFGIGTNSPDFKLDVHGTTRISDDLVVLGKIEANSFIGSVFADDSTLLIDGLNGNINATILNVSENAHINGTVQAGAFVGSLFADDSSVIVDSINKTLNSISATFGNIVLTNSEIRTDDSSNITIIQPTSFISDVTIDNDLIVLNKISTNTLIIKNVIENYADPLELRSNNDIVLNTSSRVEVSNSPFKIASFTTVERDSLISQNGDMIYNIDDNKFQGYSSGMWVNLH